ncbi:MAG: hypothetical protein OHK0040_08700 [bacterium]
MKGYKSLAIQFALKREFKGFSHSFADKLIELKQKPFLCYQMDFYGIRLIFAVSGLGKVRAAACCQHIIDSYQPEIMINVGSAGGVCPKVKPKDVFFVAAAVEYDFKSLREKTPVIGVDKHLIDEANKLNLPFAVLGSADQNADSTEKKNALHKRGITIADWEGVAVLKTCHINNIKAAAFKVVTDTSNRDFAKEFSENVFDFNKTLSSTVLSFLNCLIKSKK